ncbi:MAG: hypothetical protein NUW37_00650 [Planctomycetes bacterium]|nr:hypothetical protein [Planctomycetota bacterium]
MKIEALSLTLLVAILHFGVIQVANAQSSLPPGGVQGIPINPGDGGPANGIAIQFRNDTGQDISDITITIATRVNPTSMNPIVFEVNTAGDFQFVLPDKSRGTVAGNGTTRLKVKIGNSSEVVAPGDTFGILFHFNEDVELGTEPLPIRYAATNRNGNTIYAAVGIFGPVSEFVLPQDETSPQVKFINNTSQQIRGVEIRTDPSQTLLTDFLYAGPFSTIVQENWGSVILEIPEGAPFVNPGQEFSFDLFLPDESRLPGDQQKFVFIWNFVDKDDDGEDTEEIECHTVFDFLLFVFIVLVIGLIILLILWIAGVNPQAVRVAALVLLSQLLVVGVILLIIGISCGILVT